MATTIPNNDYVIIGQNNIVISLFHGYDLPEYNEKMTNVIDVTELSIKPQLNWIYDPNTLTYSAPAEIDVTPPPDINELSPKQIFLNEYTYLQLADVEYMGNVFNMLPNTYVYMASYAAFANLNNKLPDGFYWLNKNNQEVPMTLEQFKGFCELVSNKVFNGFIQYVNKKNNLNV